MTNMEYFAAATDVFLPPQSPVPAATIVAGIMGVQIVEMGRLHTAAARVSRTYHNVDQAFKKMLIDAFEDQFINALSDEIIGCANCTSLQLFLTF
jgi:ABC-type cobalamin/Fe3+-siderophores transport system ATPase subunit